VQRIFNCNKVQDTKLIPGKVLNTWCFTFLRHYNTRVTRFHNIAHPV